jgi:diguanylate cyclase (GGDEF)-like protein
MSAMRLLRLGDGIRSRLVLLALIAAVPFIWYRIADIRAGETANIEQIRNDAVRIAARAAGEQNEVFAEVRTLLSVIAEVPVVTDGTVDECSAFLLTVKSTRYWAKNLLVTDASGHVVCSTDPKAVGLELGDRPYFLSAATNREFAVSDFIFSRLDGQPILAAAYPTVGQNGALEGIVIATLNLAWFTNAVTDVGKNLGARVELVDASGTILARYPEPPANFGTAADMRVSQASNAAGGGSFEGKDDDGVRRLYGVAVLSGSKARAAIGFSIEAALAETRLKIQSAYINAASLGAMIILFAWLSGEFFLLTPLRDLLAATRALADGDLSARAKLRYSSNEFRELAASFNTMADRLSTLATVDALTGAANRRRFDQYLTEEWRRALRSKSPLAVLMIDVDGFKMFNDRHGHQAGDDCLRIVAVELARFARRSEDLVCRYGGEEFVIGLPGLTSSDALKHAERLRAAMENLAMPELGLPAGCITISIGVAVSVPTAGVSPDTLIAMADTALYDAKRAGRNRVALFREGPAPLSAQVA